MTASGIDAHNDLVRYAWKVVDRHGHDIIEGIDVAENASMTGVSSAS